jgi:hypothetical protein
MSAWTLQPMDAGRPRNKHRPVPADEQAALDDPDHPSDPLFEASRISDGAEIAVENSIAAVGDKRLPGRRHAHTCVGSERLDPRLCCLQAKGHDLDRYRRPHPETVDQLGFVDDDREPAAVGRHDLLVEQGAAEPLDQVERAPLHLVGAVDRQIDQQVRRERG